MPTNWQTYPPPPPTFFSGACQGTHAFLPFPVCALPSEPLPVSCGCSCLSVWLPVQGISVIQSQSCNERPQGSGEERAPNTSPSSFIQSPPVCVCVCVQADELPFRWAHVADWSHAGRFSPWHGCPFRCHHVNTISMASTSTPPTCVLATTPVWCSSLSFPAPCLHPSPTAATPCAMAAAAADTASCHAGAAAAVWNVSCTAGAGCK